MGPQYGPLLLGSLNAYSIYLSIYIYIYIRPQFYRLHTQLKVGSFLIAAAKQLMGFSEARLKHPLERQRLRVWGLGFRGYLEGLQAIG